jgi:hypothetical protein
VLAAVVGVEGDPPKIARNELDEATARARMTARNKGMSRILL